MSSLGALKNFIDNRKVTSSLPQLILRNPERFEKKWRPYQFQKDEVRKVYLGLDVGSTTTKFVLVDAETDAILYKKYVRTEGRPFEVMDAGIKEIRDEIGAHVKILHVGVTGSGREAMGAMVGADVVIDEINAHAVAAGRLYPSADTVFEIGGQDAKFIRIMHGMVEAFKMNNACAAGTGSFFDEVAHRILDCLVDELGDMALLSIAPAELGEVCTVFMKSRVVQAQSDGYSRDDIAAGLAYSIARNYLNKVKGNARIGDKIILQGGVSYNKAVISAMEQITGKEVIVPEHAESMGAIGMALIAKGSYRQKLARERTKAGAKNAELIADIAGRVKTTFRGLEASFIPAEVLEPVDKDGNPRRCGACANHCKMRFLKTADGEKLIYGMGCDLHDKKKGDDRRNNSNKKNPNLLALREELLRFDFRQGSAGAMIQSWFDSAWSGERISPAPSLQEGDSRNDGAPENRAPLPSTASGIVNEKGRVIGFPAGLNFWENFPYWHAFFTELGFEVVVSEKSGQKILDLAKRYLNIDPCLPMKMMYGMVADLLAREGVTDIFLPVVFKLKRIDPASHNSAMCPQVSGTPFALKGVFDPGKTGRRFLSPEFDFSKPDDDIARQFRKFAEELSLPPEDVERARERANSAGEDFKKAKIEAGKRILDDLEKRNLTGVVLMGRPYNSTDPGLNMGVDEMIRARGWVPIPLDFIDLEAQIPARSPDDAQNDTWHYQSMIGLAAQAVAGNPRLFPVYITNFRCGPDAFIIKEVEEEMRKAGKPLLVLEFDEHNSKAGYKTRVDAFITGIELAMEAGHRFAEKSQTIATLTARGDKAPPSGNFITLAEMRGKRILIPHMSDHTQLVAGALRAQGVNAVAIGPPDDKALQEGLKHTSGKECLPYPIVVGEVLNAVRAELKAGTDPKDIMIMFVKTGEAGQCRFSQYSAHLEKAIHTAGYPDVHVINLAGKSDTPKSKNHFTPTLELARNVWRSYLIADYMYQILLENRPYEISTQDSVRRKEMIIKGGIDAIGAFADGLDPADPNFLRKTKLADLIYHKYLHLTASAMGNEEELTRLMKAFVGEMLKVPQNRADERPLIAVSGEIYMRMNEFGNGNIVRRLEELGAEVLISPVSEFVYYVVEESAPDSFNLENLMTAKSRKELMSYLFTAGLLRYEDFRIFRTLKSGIRRREFGRGKDARHVMNLGRRYTGNFSAGEGPLSLGFLEEAVLHGALGLVMVGPMGCLPITISEALIPSLIKNLPPGLQNVPILAISISESRNMKNVMTRLEGMVYRAKKLQNNHQPALPKKSVLGRLRKATGWR